MSSNLIQMIWDSFLETIIMVAISGGIGASGCAIYIFAAHLINELLLTHHIWIAAWSGDD